MNQGLKSFSIGPMWKVRRVGYTQAAMGKERSLLWYLRSKDLLLTPFLHLSPLFYLLSFFSVSLSIFWALLLFAGSRANVLNMQCKALSATKAACAQVAVPRFGGLHFLWPSVLYLNGWIWVGEAVGGAQRVTELYHNSITLILNEETMKEMVEGGWTNQAWYARPWGPLKGEWVQLTNSLRSSGEIRGWGCEVPAVSLSTWWVTD